MKEINLLSIAEAYAKLPQPLLEKYLGYFDVSTKLDELEDLSSLTRIIEKYSLDIEHFDGFFLEYSIPQISKEFDLLRFGDNYIINIELKRTNTGDRIAKQLIRNKYYLSFLDTETHCFTYVSDDNQLFKLDDDNLLIEADFEELTNLLKNQISKKVSNIDRLFNPSNYLVSPFNSTDEFISEKYFLTSQQEQFKINIIEEINDDTTSFISITGKAGTGKTLLTYDIAKEYIKKGDKVLIIHCGYLNEGQESLVNDHGWGIIPIRDIYNVNLYDYSLVVVDETQRIYPLQLNYIISVINKNNGNCIFAYDKQQWLRKNEANNKIDEQIKIKTQSSVFDLTEKIRTNKEIASFILCLLDKGRKVENIYHSNIELSYFSSYESAKKYLEFLNESEWKVINYTHSKGHHLPYDNFSISFIDNAHFVIGQEFDNVVAVVDAHFYYNEDNKLSTRGYKPRPYYHPTKMLFQILTRTRRKLSFIVINNEEVMDRCLTILKT